MAESPKFLHFKGNRGEEHNGNLIFSGTGNGNTAVSCMRNNKYAISLLLMAESLKFSRLNGNRGQGA